MPAARTSPEIWSHVRDIENAFFPAVLNTSAGGRITWSNTLGLPHKQSFYGAGLVAQPGVPARTNLDYLQGTFTDTAIAATGVAFAVPIAVEVGDVITNVCMPVGATAASGSSHGNVGIYSRIATPALLATGTDNPATAAGTVANPLLVRPLTAPYTIKAADAPSGYIWASYTSTNATTLQNTANMSIIAGFNYAWFTGGPAFFCQTHGSALAGVMPATITGGSGRVTAPVVFLT